MPDVPRSFEEAVELFRRCGEPVVHGWLYEAARPVRFEPGRIELALAGEGAPKDLPSRVGEALSRWTGRRWVVSLATHAPGEPTLAERAEAHRRRRLGEVGGHPAVKAVLDTFPGATIVDVSPRGEAL
jgi:DNA polymerase III subunit gamma/tau